MADNNITVYLCIIKSRGDNPAVWSGVGYGAKGPHEARERAWFDAIHSVAMGFPEVAVAIRELSWSDKQGFRRRLQEAGWRVVESVHKVGVDVCCPCGETHV